MSGMHSSSFVNLPCNLHIYHRFDILENEEERNKEGGAIFIKGIVTVKREMLTEEGCTWLDRDITDRASKPTRLGESKQNVTIVAEIMAFPVYKHGKSNSCQLF